MKSLLCALILSLACLATSADSDNARLLAAKNILNEILVEGRDLTVQYTIYNVGGRWVLQAYSIVPVGVFSIDIHPNLLIFSSAARDVQLVDASFPDSDFEIVRGSLEATWSRIAP